MIIKKYKYIGKNKYELTIDDENKVFYEDIILKYNLLLKKEITKKELESLIKENEFYEIYYKGIEILNRRKKTKKELKESLKKYYDNETQINKAIERIDKEGYINNKDYSRSYIFDSMKFKNYGPYKIKRQLLDLGVEENIIDEELKVFTKDIIDEKIKKHINKKVKTNTNKSERNLKEKIIQSLISDGYQKEDIIRNLNNISFDDSTIEKKEYEKLYKKLSNKYSGKELELKLKQKMYQKGFYNKND